MPDNTIPQQPQGGPLPQPLTGQPVPPAQPTQTGMPAQQPVPPMQPVQPARPAVQINIGPAPQTAKPVQPPVQQMQQPVMTTQQAQPLAPQAPQMQAPQMQPQMAPQMQPASAARPVYQAGRPAPAMMARPGQPLKPGVAMRKPPNPKRLIYGCTGCFGAALLFFIVFVLIFVSQTSATGENPLAKSLGVDTASFINTLITIVNLVFLAVEVVMFLLVTVGLFRFFMARKDDKDAKRRGLTLAGITFMLLLFLGGIWLGIYMYLDSKRVPIQKTQTASGIVTDPTPTLGLTAPVTITFDGTKVPENTTTYVILSYLWSFGDGQSSSVPKVSHIYKDMGPNNGRYDVSLAVTKRNKTTNVESTDTFTTLVTIANVKLNGVIAATPDTGPAPLEVSFDASGSTAPAGQIVSYDWDFNNLNLFTDAHGATATHTFDKVGTYTVDLRVTDNTGQFAVVTQDITVTPPNTPTAVIDIPTTDGKYYVGQQYNFQGDKSTSPAGVIQKYVWDFGDGSPNANTRTAVHIYKTAGDYQVDLKVTDEKGGTGEITQKITVETQESAPIAVIETVPPPNKNEDFISGQVPFEVSFDGSKSTDIKNSIVDYKWDFDGDGTDDAAGNKVTYVYKDAGTYNATLTVINANNLQSKTSIVVKVGAQPLQAKITATPVEGVIPLTVTFDAGSSSYPNGQIVSYQWDFGDGSPKRIDVAKVVYKYTKIGTFTASVTAIASDNSKSTASTPVNVRPVALNACFEASVETGPAPLTVEFDPRCSTGTVAKYSWDFGDGETSRTRKPTHTFATPGSYQVTLEVADNQNVLNTFNKTILVTGTIQ